MLYYYFTYTHIYTCTHTYTHTYIHKYTNTLAYIDAQLKPWLLEVNASPSLTANTKEDYMMKTEMLHGMLDIIDMDNVLQGAEEHISGWDLVYDNGFIGMYGIYSVVKCV